MTLLHAVEAAFTAAAHLNDTHSAVMELFRTYARTIDTAVALGDPGELTKALFGLSI